VLSGCKSEQVPDYCLDVVPVNNENINQLVRGMAKYPERAGVSCHNCYDNRRNDLVATMQIIDNALYSDVDFIELDLIGAYHSENFDINVNHDSKDLGPKFKDIISHSRLLNISQMLLLELKFGFDSDVEIEYLLDSLMEHVDENDVYTYLNKNRLLTIKVINDFKLLAQVRDVIATEKYAKVKQYIKLSQILFSNQKVDLSRALPLIKQCGFHMVELDLRMGLESINYFSNVASELNLAVGVFSINQKNVEQYVGKLSKNINVITVHEQNSQLSGSNLFDRVISLLEGSRR